MAASTTTPHHAGHPARARPFGTLRPAYVCFGSVHTYRLQGSASAEVEEAIYGTAVYAAEIQREPAVVVMSRRTALDKDYPGQICSLIRWPGIATGVLVVLACTSRPRKGIVIAQQEYKVVRRQRTTVLKICVRSSERFAIRCHAPA